jgi:hypothetical protein
MNILHHIESHLDTGIATGFAAVIVYFCFNVWGRWDDNE